MNLSGIVVAVSPEKLLEGIAALNTIPNLEVFQSDPITGQIVVVQEAENVNLEVEGLKKIKSLPMVTYAEMVYHYMAEDQQISEFQINNFNDDANSSLLDETLEKLNQ